MRAARDRRSARLLLVLVMMSVPSSTSGATDSTERGTWGQAIEPRMR